MAEIITTVSTPRAELPGADSAPLPADKARGVDPRFGKPDATEANRFLKALTRLDRSGETYTYQTFDDSAAKRPQLAKIFHGKGNGERLKQLNAQGAGIFVMVNAGDGKGRAERNVKRVRALFIDADKNGAAVLKAVKVSGLAPHIVVESSPGKYHVYWIVAPDFPMEKFTAAQQALARKFGTDATVSDLPRVLRLPGFFHMKNPAAPFKVRIVELNDA